MQNFSNTRLIGSFCQLIRYVASSCVPKYSAVFMSSRPKAMVRGCGCDVCLTDGNAHVKDAYVCFAIPGMITPSELVDISEACHKC